MPKSAVLGIHRKLDLAIKSDDPVSKLKRLNGNLKDSYKIGFGGYRARIRVNELHKHLVIEKIGPRENFYD